MQFVLYLLYNHKYHTRKIWD